MAKISEEPNFGQAIFNLDIELSAPKISSHYKGDQPPELTQRIRTAIDIGRRLLVKSHFVTDKGFLLPGHLDDLDTQTAVLELFDNVAGLRTLERVLRGEVESKHNLYVEVHFNELGSEGISVEDGHLYFPEVRDEYAQN